MFFHPLCADMGQLKPGGSQLSSELRVVGHWPQRIVGDVAYFSSAYSH